MATHLTNLASRFTNSAASAVHSVHGAGEVIRGTTNSTIDGLVPNHESREGGGRARQDEISQKGLGEMRGAEQYFHDGAPPERNAAHCAGDGGGAAPIGAGYENFNGGYGASSGPVVGGGQGPHGGGVGQNGNWGGSNAGDIRRQEREQEKMWDTERQQRETEYQQQTVPGSFPEEEVADVNQFPQSSTSQQQYHSQPPPPPPIAYQSPGQSNHLSYGANQGQGFQHGRTLRETSGPGSPSSPTSRNGYGSHSGLGSRLLHHHKDQGHGQGKWLSQGGVRAAPEEFGPHYQQPQEEPNKHAGAEAARLAWNSTSR